jgi:hypothetical protein
MGVQLTVEEVVAHLKGTNLPSLVVEGKDDMTVYRWIEREMGTAEVDLLPVGGRNNVLAVWARNAEFPNAKVAFLVDSDLELFTGSPLRSPKVILTRGYSIENDVLSTGTAAALMTVNEAKHFQTMLDHVCEWFAFEVDEYLNGRAPEFSHHVDRLVPKDKNILCPLFCAHRGFKSPPAKLKQQIRKKYDVLLRGKHLLSCYVRCLSGKSRQNNKYSADNLLDLSTKFPKRTTHLKRIMAQVQAAL